MKFIQVHEESDQPGEAEILHFINVEHIITLFRRDNARAGLYLTTFGDPVLLTETYDYIFNIIMSTAAAKG